MPKKTEFTPMNKAADAGKISSEDMQDIRKVIFFEIMSCLERVRDLCLDSGLQPEECGLFFKHPNESRGKHYACIAQRIG